MSATAAERTYGETTYMRARAHVARRLIAEGRLDPDLGLSFVVWPTPEIEETERACPTGTIVGRAYSRKHNP